MSDPIKGMGKHSEARLHSLPMQARKRRLNFFPPFSAHSFAHFHEALPLQLFCPLQALVSVLQAECPLQAFTPPHLTMPSVLAG